MKGNLKRPSEDKTFHEQARPISIIIIACPPIIIASVLRATPFVNAAGMYVSLAFMSLALCTRLIRCTEEVIHVRF
jgi:hypothetical protein